MSLSPVTIAAGMRELLAELGQPVPGNAELLYAAMEAAGETPVRMELREDDQPAEPPPPGRSERESADTLVNRIIDQGAHAGVLVSREVRRRIRSLLKKKARSRRSNSSASAG